VGEYLIIIARLRFKQNLKKMLKKMRYLSPFMVRTELLPTWNDALSELLKVSYSKNS
jgi:hypothetical protein